MPVLVRSSSPTITAMQPGQTLWCSCVMAESSIARRLTVVRHERILAGRAPPRVEGPHLPPTPYRADRLADRPAGAIRGSVYGLRPGRERLVLRGGRLHPYRVAVRPARRPCVRRDGPFASGPA